MLNLVLIPAETFVCLSLATATHDCVLYYTATWIQIWVYDMNVDLYGMECQKSLNLADSLGKFPKGFFLPVIEFYPILSFEERFNC